MGPGRKGPHASGGERPAASAQAAWGPAAALLCGQHWLFCFTHSAAKTHICIFPTVLKTGNYVLEVKKTPLVLPSPCSMPGYAMDYILQEQIKDGSQRQHKTKTWVQLEVQRLS